MEINAVCIAPYDFYTSARSFIRKGDKLIVVSEGTHNIKFISQQCGSIVWYDKDVGQFNGCEIWGTPLEIL